MPLNIIAHYQTDLTVITNNGTTKIVLLFFKDIKSYYLYIIINIILDIFVNYGKIF